MAKEKKRNKAGWICTAKDANGTFYTVEHPLQNLKAVQKDFAKGNVHGENDAPLELVSALPAGEYHVCQYCGGIAQGGNKDVLCKECAETFGHELFSSL